MNAQVFAYHGGSAQPGFGNPYLFTSIANAELCILLVASTMAVDTQPSKGTLPWMLSIFTATNVLILLAICVGVRLYRQHAALSQFKGPPGVGISKKWLLFDCLWSSKMHLVLWEVNKKYGQSSFPHTLTP